MWDSISNERKGTFKMNAFERMSALIGELCEMFTRDLGGLFLLGFFVMAFLLRKEFGGCFIAGIKLFGLLFFAFILQSIHPMALIIFLAAGLLVWLSGNNWGKIKGAIIVLVIFGTFCFVVYQNFLVWLRSGHFLYNRKVMLPIA